MTEFQGEFSDSDSGLSDSLSIFPESAPSLKQGGDIPSLTDIFADEKKIKVFRQFLEDQCNVQNYKFWLVCEHYRSIDEEKHDRLHTVATAIYKKFIEHNASHRVNLSRRIKNEIKNRFKMHPPDLFADAQAHIWNSMEANEYQQFISVVLDFSSLNYNINEASLCSSKLKAVSVPFPQLALATKIRARANAQKSMSDCHGKPQPPYRPVPEHKIQIKKNRCMKVDVFVAFVNKSLLEVIKIRENMKYEMKDNARRDGHAYDIIMEIEWYDHPKAIKYSWNQQTDHVDDIWTTKFDMFVESKEFASRQKSEALDLLYQTDEGFHQPNPKQYHRPDSTNTARICQTIAPKKLCPRTTLLSNISPKKHDYHNCHKQYHSVRQPTVIACDHCGRTIDCGFGIEVRVPEGAIPKGITAYFEIGVAMYGPFNYSTNRRPISPILWLCTQEDVTFQKPIEIVMPHFMIGLRGKDFDQYEVHFAKADHNDYSVNADGRNRYNFQDISAAVEFKIPNGTDQQAYGVLQTTHCCFLCIQAKQCKEIASKAGYCLSRVEPIYNSQPPRINSLHFCLSFFLPTCLKAIKNQYPSSDFDITSKCFTFSEVDNPTLRLNILSDETCRTISEPTNKKIHASKVDVWGADLSEESLELMHKMKMHPPRFTTKVISSSKSAKLSCTFEGTTCDDDLTSDVFLLFDPQSLPSTVSAESPLEEDKELGIEDLRDVCIHLKYLDPNDTIELGLALGLSIVKLKSLEPNPKSLLREMIYAWLRKEDNVLKHGKPTKRTLMEALKEIGQEGIASSFTTG